MNLHEATLVELLKEEWGGESIYLDTVETVSHLIGEVPSKIRFCTSDDDFNFTEEMQLYVDNSAPVQVMNGKSLFIINNINLVFEYSEGGLVTWFFKQEDIDLINKLWK